MRQVTLIGRSGSNPELKYTPNQTPIVNLSIAVTERRADAQETNWFSVVCFSKVAEIVHETVKKGYEVLVIGNLSSRSWKDRDGKMQNKVEVIGNIVRVTRIPKEKEEEDHVPY